MPRLPYVALLLLLAVPPDATATDHAAEDEGAPVVSGPVTRRPPPRPADPDLPAEPVEAAEPAAEGEPAAPVVAVLDPSVFDGVFAAYVVRDGREIPEPLVERPRDPVAGRRLYHNFSRTGCSLCHGTAEAPREASDSRAGPPLDRIAERLSPGRLRLWIVAPATIRPETAMPAFHKPGQRENPLDPLYGGPRLTAAEVEDIVAYLAGKGTPGAVPETEEDDVGRPADLE